MKLLALISVFVLVAVAEGHPLEERTPVAATDDKATGKSQDIYKIKEATRAGQTGVEDDDSSVIEDADYRSPERGHSGLKLSGEKWPKKVYSGVNREVKKEAKVPVPPFGFGFEDSEDSEEEEEEASFEPDGIYFGKPHAKPDVHKGKEEPKFGVKHGEEHGKIPKHGGGGHKPLFGLKPGEKKDVERGKIDPKLIYGQFLPVGIPLALDPRFGLYDRAFFGPYGIDPYLYYDALMKEAKASKAGKVELGGSKSKEPLKAEDKNKETRRMEPLVQTTESTT